MKAYKVKIISAGLPMYWYAGNIGEIFWVTENTKSIDEHIGYEVINEGVFVSQKEMSTRWIHKDDCEILKESDVYVNKVTLIQVIER